tara:strand:- start:6818 stop:7216 length:399 start_codon:yes stop_codon:yes gene_type:complete
MENQISKNYGKQLVVLIISVFIIFSGAFRIGSLRSNSPVDAGEELLIYSSVFNPGASTLKDVRLSYLIFDAEGSLFDSVDVGKFDVKRNRERGRTSLYDTSGFGYGDHWVKVTANHKGDTRTRYLPIDVIVG